MAPGRRKGVSKAAAAAAARRRWKLGDLVLAKVKGFPAWPAMVTDPEKWGYSGDWKKVLVLFFGTQQIAFCNPADVEEFTEEKEASLSEKCRGKGADFDLAVKEIVDCYQKLKKQDQVVSDNCNEETISINVNNSAESMSTFETKDEAPAVTVESPPKMPLSVEATNDLNFLTEAAVAAAAEEALHDGVMQVEEAGASLVAINVPVSASYSTGSKAVDAQPRKDEGKSMTSARRSRSSSRIDSSRLEKVILPSNSNNRSSSIGTNALQVRSGRRRKRSKKSLDNSDLYDAYSPIFLSIGSIQEDDSETVTVDSDAMCFNQGNTLDSAGKSIQSESGVECHEAKAELSDRLDFQTNTVVVKKKRMANRKRMINDTAESEVVSDADLLKAQSVLCINDEKYAERSTKEDGDDHLPLVKRARIHMDRPSSVGEEECNLVHTEEEISEVSKRIQICEPLNHKEDGDANQMSVFVKGYTDNPPLSKASSAKKPQIWEARKKFVDGEAVLPPSKRLHRALEAMSANGVEDGQKASECPSTLVTSIDGYCFSRNCSELSMGSKARIEPGAEKVGSPCKNVSHHGASEFYVGSNPEMLENNVKSSVVVAGCSKSSYIVDISNSEPHLSKPAESADSKCLKKSLLNEHSAELNVSQTNLKSESPNVNKEQIPVDANNCPLRLTMHSTNICKAECSVLTKTFNSPDVSPRTDSVVVEEIKIGSLQSDTDMDKDIVSGEGDETTRIQDFLLAENNEDNQISGIDKEAGPGLKDSNALAFATPVKLTIGGHQQSLSHSNFISEDCLADKTASAPQPSSSLADGLDSVALASSPRFSICNMSASGNKSLTERNSCFSADVHLHIHKATRAGKLSCKEEADVDVSSFETILGSLSRTKESIVRATRIAIECAKLGFSNKVMEILACNLEYESSFRRKVDLFFLVDSIAQCSQGMKGDAGIYPSVIQVLLPRLLLAAAPPSSISHENHRQCLKVLRVWQERNILPEYIIRTHIRELDALCGSYSTRASSRRPLRNERAFDDPIREMEDMLVDEYGSNSSIQLPGFCMPPVLRDEDGGSDSDGDSFEAVTPEHNAENIDGERTSIPAVEKRSHILEDVDGELEMEDVTPSREPRIISHGNITSSDSAQTTHHQPDNQFWAPFVHPLDEGVHPTSPLPRSSPPPPPPSAFRPPMPDTIFNGSNLKHYPSLQNIRSNFHESVANHSVMHRANATTSDSLQAHVLRQMPDHTNSCSFSGRPVSHTPVRASNGIRPPEGSLNKSFHVPPPQPSPSNQFSYVQDQRMQLRRDVSLPPYPYRSHTRNAENENFYGGCDRMKIAPHDDIGECWRPPFPSFSGPCYYPDGPRMPCSPLPFTGPHGPALHHNSWDFPHHPMNHRQFTPYSPHSGGPIPVANRGSNYWRPRWAV